MEQTDPNGWRTMEAPVAVMYKPLKAKEKERAKR
jgi:hypothetical protein